MLLITADGSVGVVVGTSILIVPIVAVSTNETFANEPVPSTVRFVIVPSVVRFVISNELLIVEIIILLF